MGSHGSIATEIKLRASDFKHLVHPKYVKGLTRSDVAYGRTIFGLEPLHGQEVLAIVGRFRHRIDGSGMLLSDSWQRLTYDLAAVSGSTGDTVLWFQCVTTHRFDRWLSNRSRVNDDKTHLFVLGPGELVRAIDISWVDLRFVGIRIQTNQRQSPWFGSRNGVVKTVTAPNGYFINALRNLQPTTGVWELGLRLCPIIDRCGRPMGLDTLITTKSDRVGARAPAADGLQVEFVDVLDEIQAVIVRCSADVGIKDLHVLSAEQYGRHLAKREDPLRAGEHIVYLRKTEYLVQVDVIIAPMLAGIRFHSNLCTSPWFGRPATDDAAVHRFTCATPKQQICGFHGTFGETALGAFGVFFAPLPTRAPSKAKAL